MEFQIRGKVYPAIVKRVKVKGKLKLRVFFNTNDCYHSGNGFDLPNFCCSRIKCRWKSVRKWKEDLVDQRLIFPK